MPKFKSIALALVIGIAAIGLSAATTSATVILNIDGSGQLTGAQNVDVGGTLYDVTFVDGTCASFFAGCDSPSVFDFITQASADMAAQALLDQVFLDTTLLGQFDSDPGLTIGCLGFNQCQTFIPYELFPFVPGFIYSRYAYNLGSFTTASDFTGGVGFLPDATTIGSHANFARFSPAKSTSIPEPGTLLLFAVGLATLAGFGRRRRQG